MADFDENDYRTLIQAHAGGIAYRACRHAGDGIAWREDVIEAADRLKAFAQGIPCRPADSKQRPG